jgi:hypothetical protein
LEIIRHGHTGLLLEAGCDEASAKALLELHRDKQQAVVLAPNALIQVRQEYDFQTSIEREAIYQEKSNGIS